MSDQGNEGGFDFAQAAESLFGNSGGDDPNAEAQRQHEESPDHIPNHTEATAPKEVQDFNDAKNNEYEAAWRAESENRYSEADISTAKDFIRADFTPEMQQILAGPIGNNPHVIAQIIQLAKKYGY